MFYVFILDRLSVVGSVESMLQQRMRFGDAWCPARDQATASEVAQARQGECVSDTQGWQGST